MRVIFMLELYRSEPLTTEKYTPSHDVCMHYAHSNVIDYSIRATFLLDQF